jgi:type IV secretory pathway ATPase VirB11/archaellum biosynthesis ATPase
MANNDSGVNVEYEVADNTGSTGLTQEMEDLLLIQPACASACSISVEYQNFLECCKTAAEGDPAVLDSLKAITKLMKERKMSTTIIEDTLAGKYTYFNSITLLIAFVA